MPVVVLALPGAPLALPALTPGLDSPPQEVASLREAAADAVAGAGTGSMVVVTPAPAAGAWPGGDLGLGGFGTGDPSLSWHARDANLSDVLPDAAGPLPVEARVAARLVGVDRVSAIVGLPPDEPDLAARLFDAVRDGLAVVGDLSAGIGPHSPRPGDEAGFDQLVRGVDVDMGELAGIVTSADAVSAALQVLAHPRAPAMTGSVHVVRGVATLVATSAARRDSGDTR